MNYLDQKVSHMVMTALSAINSLPRPAPIDDAIGTVIKMMVTITDEAVLIGSRLGPWRNSTRAGRGIRKQVEVEEASSDELNYTIRGVRKKGEANTKIARTTLDDIIEPIPEGELRVSFVGFPAVSKLLTR